MNFIIAVVGKAYTDCMETKAIRILRIKLEMIYDYELRMNDKQLSDKNWFPQYILLRRPVDKSLKTETNITKDNLSENLNHLKIELESKIQKGIQDLQEIKSEIKSEIGEMKV